MPTYKELTKGAEIFYNSNHRLLEIVFKSHISITKLDALEIHDTSVSLTQNLPHYNIIDASMLSKISSEARSFFASLDDKNVLGAAILTNNEIQKIFANLYLKINKPKIPTKHFTTRTEAINWINKQQNKLNH